MTTRQLAVLLGYKTHGFNVYGDEQAQAWLEERGLLKWSEATHTTPPYLHLSYAGGTLVREVVDFCKDSCCA